MYDLSTSKETQITTIKSNKNSVHIFGNRIVWCDYRNGNPDIYMYDISTSQETQITNDGSMHICPAIYDNKIVWLDNRGGIYCNVYMAIIQEEAATPAIIWNNPADITYGTALNSTQLDAVAKDPVSGVIVEGTYIYDPVAGTQLPVGDGQKLHVDFKPNDTAKYTVASKDVTINVMKATSTITWNNPADIISGTALSSAQLNAIASVPGTFSYTPASGTILNAGTQVLHVDFTPSDSANYTTASKDVTINVVAATLKNPTITWSNPKDIIYGTALSSTQLNAVASVPGTLTYIPPSGTVLSAGIQALKVDFIPTDIANYNTATQTITINVLTHVQGIQQITAKVQSLNLVPEQANLLIVKLDTATKNLNNGNTLGAATELNAFTNQVNAFINNGKISSSEGKALIDDTNDLIKAMNNIFNFPAASVPEFPSVALPVVAILGLVMIFGRKKE